MDKPSIDIAEQYTFADKVTVSCKAEGNPAPEISWSKDGKSLTGSGSSLTFNRIEYSDAGYYTCTAKNPANELTASDVIIVSEEAGHATQDIETSGNANVDESDSANQRTLKPEVIIKLETMAKRLPEAPSEETTVRPTTTTESTTAEPIETTIEAPTETKSDTSTETSVETSTKAPTERPSVTLLRHRLKHKVVHLLGTPTVTTTESTAADLDGTTIEVECSVKISYKEVIFSDEPNSADLLLVCEVEGPECASKILLYIQSTRLSKIA